MRFPGQSDDLANHGPTWFERAPRQTTGGAHRDGVVRGLIFLAAMIGVFALLTTSTARPAAPYAVAALGRG